MKQYLFFVPLFIMSSFFYQKQSSSQELNSFKVDHVQLKNLDSLIKLTKSKKEIDLMVDYSEKYIELAIKSKEYKKAISRGIKVIYYINTHFGQRERAFKLLNKIEKFKNKIDDSFLIGAIYLKKGGLYFNGENYTKAIDNYTIAINTFTDKDSIHSADAYFFRGQAYYNGHNFLSALSSYEKALDFYTALNDIHYTFYTKSAMINIHGANGFIDKAIQERLKLINEKIETNFTLGLSNDYQNLAAEYKKNKQYKKQEFYLTKAVEKAKKENDEFKNLSYIYCDLAQYYLDKNQNNKAKIYYELATKLIKSSDNDNYHYYKKLKSYYLYKNNNLKQALAIANQVLYNAKKQHHTQEVIDAEKLLYKIYKTQNNFGEALKHYDSYNYIKDSIFNIEKLNILYYYQTLHEKKVNDQKIQQQKSDILILKKEKKNKYILLISLLVLSLSIITLIYFFLNSRYLKRKQRLQRLYSQNLLSYIDNERKRVSKDLHDSLGQKLLLVKNQVLINSDKKGCELVNEAINEIRIISKNLQPNQIKQIGITKSIEDLIYELDSNYSSILLFGDIDNIDHLLNPKQELNVYRIIQECLNNIIKHSKADSAQVIINETRKRIFLSIKDNGVGFNYYEKYQKPNSIGLKNLKNRVIFLKGLISIKSILNKGTTIEISFPKI